MKKIILFDIDDTIINTELFRKIQDETLANYLGVDDQEIKKVRSDYYFSLKKSTDFFIDDYLKIVAKKYHHDLENLKKVFFGQRNIQLCLYEDVKPVFAKLKKLGYTLGVFSEGFVSFQKFKLETNDLLKFFDHEYIFLLRRKIDPNILKKLPQNTIIVDDKPTIINKLKNFANITPIQIIRENKQANPKVTEKVITSLSELI